VGNPDLLIGIALGLVLAGVAGAYLHERSLRHHLQALVREQGTKLADLSQEVANIRLASGNKLYSRALRDVGFAAKQSMLRVRAARAHLVEELDTIDKLLDLAPKE